MKRYEIQSLPVCAARISILMIEMKFINWAFPVRLTSASIIAYFIKTNFLFLKWFIHLSQYFNCLLIEQLQPIVIITIRFQFLYENTWYIAIVFKVNILKKLLIVIQTVEYISIVHKINNIFIIIKLLHWLKNLVFLDFLDCGRYRSATWSAKLYLWANKPSSKLFLLTFLEESFLCRQ